MARWFQWLGQAVDYHCSANGKVFLAFGRADLETLEGDPRFRLVYSYEEKNQAVFERVPGA